MTRTFDGSVKTHFVRRFIFFSLVFVTTLFALSLLGSVFQKDGLTVLEGILLFFYAVLFSWICLPFWTATFGFFILLWNKDKYAISASLKRATPLTAQAKTALVMPVYNEDPHRVFAGLRSIAEALINTGNHAYFDIFILSDTRNPELWAEEELRWQALQRDMQGKINVYYRNRERNTERKVGNLKDFLTRWGGHYRYMIVLDADSIMTGELLVKMVQIMEVNPTVGLMQVPPVPVNRESPFARIQQFAGRIYGAIFTAGLNFWQLSEGNYWGHNAIIRVKPFVDHCGLPHLRGREPFGGEILSHDFIEAALLRRAGWEVWLAYDLEGSYEEIPPTLIDYAKRDRRWCQGNLQHTGILTLAGLHPINRMHVVTGIMSYLASPLWLLFLVATGIDAYFRAQQETVYFFGDTLFPVWPEYHTVEMTTVLVVTLAFLFLPKILGLLLVFMRGDNYIRTYGGKLRLSASVLLETLSSMLLAPILMLFQTHFVIAILFRRNINWGPQNRDDHQTGFVEALFAHWFHTFVGIAVGFFAYHYIPDFFWWLIPVLAGLVLSVPLSMLISNAGIGRYLKKQGLFLIPEETQPPQVLLRLEHHLAQEDYLAASSVERFTEVLLDPQINALHAALLPVSKPSKRQKHRLQGLIYQLLEDGIESLTPAERRELLADRDTVLELHTLAWSLPHLAESFGKTHVS